MTISIDIDPWDVFDQISDEELLREVKDRRLLFEEPVLIEVQELLLRGNVYLAQRAIERHLQPEFDSRTDYEQARGGKHPFLVVSR